MQAQTISDRGTTAPARDENLFAHASVGWRSHIVERVASLALTASLFLSSMYCLLAYIPTTYFAFIQAPFQSWMPLFARFQPWIVASTFFATAIAQRGRWREKTARGILLEFWLLGAFGSAWLAWARPVQFLRNDSLSFVWALAFLLPVICLGMLDYVCFLSRLKQPETPPQRISYKRVVLAALFVSFLNPAASCLRSYIAAMPVTITWNSLPALLWAAITQVLLFMLVFSLVELLAGLADRAANRARMRFLANTAVWWMGSAICLAKVVLASIPFEGTEAIIYSCWFALVGVIFVAGWFLRSRVRSCENPVPAPQPASPRVEKARHALGLLLIAASAVIVPALIGTMDWNSVLEKVWAVTLWGIAGFMIVYRGPRHAPRRHGWPLAVTAVLSFIALYSGKSWAHHLVSTQTGTDSILRQYATVDASYAAASEIVGRADEVPCNEHCQFLAHQTNIPPAASVELRDIDLVSGLRPAGGLRPNIFIIVVDSLRQDYIAAYNPAVSFTPAIADFARESVVFRNAFTRYSGTTLSEPSIWSGMLQLHKHYVQPFHRVNGLEKLLQADGYQRMVSVDTVLRVLLQPSPDLTPLDETASKWTDVDFCTTANEASQKLSHRKDPNKPVFMYTQPQNIHIVTLGKTAALRPAKKKYAPFTDYYASELERLDGCFGQFVHGLKTQGLYDNSIIVLTADHGEALQQIGGERHAFSLKPEVIRVPLIIHVPQAIKNSWYYDPDLIAFNTDIAATLYELLGHGPVIARPEFGRPLFTRTAADMQKYRRESYMIASSYGPIYGLLFDNGKKLFTDTQTSQGFFDLEQDPTASHNLLTEAMRTRFEGQVENDLQGIAALYGYKYKPPTLMNWLIR